MWPMMELAEFHAAQQASKEVGGKPLCFLPIFYHLQIKDLDDETINDRWMPIWREHERNNAERIDIQKWHAAVRAIRKTDGLIFGESEVQFRRAIVQVVTTRFSPPDVCASSRDFVGYDRLSQTISTQSVKDDIIGAQVLGLYGVAGIGKTVLSRASCDYFHKEFEGKTWYIKLGGPSKLDWPSKSLQRKKMVLRNCVVLRSRSQMLIRYGH